MKKLLLRLSILTLLLLTSTLVAQSDSSTVKPFKHEIGAAIGFTIGHGLSYRFWPKRAGVQVAFALNRNDGYPNNYTVGFSFLFKLIESKYTNLFLYQGNAYSYSESTPYWNDNSAEYMNNGIGIGINFIALKRVSINIMGGYAAYNDLDRVGMTGEFGLFYKF